MHVIRRQDMLTPLKHLIPRLVYQGVPMSYTVDDIDDFVIEAVCCNQGNVINKIYMTVRRVRERFHTQYSWHFTRKSTIHSDRGPCNETDFSTLSTETIDN
jgi:hypothetical protein